MNFCTRCGRKLPASGECPYCAGKYFARRTQPMIQAVNGAGSSYTTLTLACIWSLSILCLMVFSILELNPLLLLALPGMVLVVGLWLVFAGQGHTRRLGLGFAIVALQLMSILVALVLAFLCLMCIGAIFLCTQNSSYAQVSISLVLLSVGLLLALPLSVLFFHRLRRMAITSRSVLLRSRSVAEVPLYTILMFFLGTVGLSFAAVNVTAADRLISLVSPMVQELIPGLFSLLFTLLIGLSWSGMMIPLLLLALSCLFTGFILIRYRYRIYRAKKEMQKLQREKEAEKQAAAPKAGRKATPKK